jgi:hypothetical protein
MNLFAVAALLLAPLALHGQSAAQQPPADPGAPGVRTARPSLTIDRAAGPISIDGDLTDAGWVGAARVDGFVEFQPRDAVPAPVDTEALVTYDDRHLYVAFIAHDPSPGQIRATLQQRDRMWNDDWVGVVIDPRGDGTMGYMLFANPLGVQGDMQATPQGEDGRIDFVYHTAGRLTPDGYVVEMAIPFSSLRFPDRDVQSWRITFARRYPRSSEHMMSWAPLSQNNPCLLCQLGSLEGITGIRAGGTLELLPALVASQSGTLSDRGDPASFASRRVSAEPSLGLKYVFRSGWMAEATVNPDFSQVESDAAQVDVNTTFALFYPERRPFFQEGMDLYETRMNVFYSRSINAPQLAAKLSGRVGGTSFGYIGARDEHTPFILPFEERSAIVQGGSSVTNVFRVRQGIYGDSHVGAIVADRRMDGGGSGTTASLDAVLRFRDVYRLSAHVVGSHTAEPVDSALSARIPDLRFGDAGHTARFDGESFTGRAASLQLARNARVWSWNANYSEASPTYRADAGFQTRNDFRRVSAWSGVDLRPDRHGVERVQLGVGGGRTWNFRGEAKEAWITPSFGINLPRQTYVGLNGSLRRETFRGVELDGMRWLGVNAGSELGSAVRLRAWAGTGRTVARMFSIPEIASGREAGASATLNPFQRLVIEPSVNYARLDRLDGEEIYAGYIARTRVNVQYNRELQLRTVVQYNDFSRRLDVEPLVVYQLNPFTMMYLGSTHGSSHFDELGYRRTDRQYFAKFQYLLRR